jgi:hypothetical protein
MIEEYKSSSWHDFRQRYQNTYGWYQSDSGKRVLVRVEKVAESSLSFIDREDNVYTALPDKGNQFQFIPVEKGLHNTENGVVMCERKTARQFQRGLCAANTVLKNLSLNGSIAVEFSSVENIFHNGVNDYLSRFKKNPKMDVALNDTFGIVNGTIMLYNLRIGTFTDSKLLLNTNLFAQEVQDLVQKLELPFIVEVK